METAHVWIMPASVLLAWASEELRRGVDELIREREERKERGEQGEVSF